jgi:hypothetical protein
MREAPHAPYAHCRKEATMPAPLPPDYGVRREQPTCVGSADFAAAAEAAVAAEKAAEASKPGA